jgi:hypothetical protein
LPPLAQCSLLTANLGIPPDILALEAPELVQQVERNSLISLLLIDVWILLMDILLPSWAFYGSGEISIDHRKKSRLFDCAVLSSSKVEIHLQHTSPFCEVEL